MLVGVTDITGYSIGAGGGIRSVPTPFAPGGGGTIGGIPGTTLPPTIGGGGLQPPTGIDIPGTPLGGGVCPSGTRCIGPSFQGPFGLTLCLGTCSPYGTGGGGTGGTGGTADLPMPLQPVNGGGGVTPSGPSAAAGACPSGYRPNKSDYFLKDGTFVAKGTRCVRIRRRDLGNTKALRRADSRVDGFVNLARSALRHTGYRVVSKSSRVRRGPRTVVESGPGSVVS
jgi:hypothetical protein